MRQAPQHRQPDLRFEARQSATGLDDLAYLLFIRSLRSQKNGKAFLPVAPFCTYRTGSTADWELPAWTDCDHETAWYLDAGEYAGEQQHALEIGLQKDFTSL